MRFGKATMFAAALMLLVSSASWADLSPYSQDFEGLVQADPDALANDGWLVFANVFTAGGSYLYGYGPFPAPNGGPAFCGIATGQGGAINVSSASVSITDSTFSSNSAEHGAAIMADEITSAETAAGHSERQHP